MNPAKLLFGRKILSKAQHVNMGAACNHTEILKWDRERKQMGKNICLQSENYLESNIRDEDGVVFHEPNTDNIRLSFELTLYEVGNKLRCTVKIVLLRYTTREILVIIET